MPKSVKIIDGKYRREMQYYCKICGCHIGNSYGDDRISREGLSTAMCENCIRKSSLHPQGTEEKQNKR